MLSVVHDSDLNVIIEVIDPQDNRQLKIYFIYVKGGDISDSPPILAHILHLKFSIFTDVPW